MPIDVGVIGFGRFGRLVVRHLAAEPDLRVRVFDAQMDDDAAGEVQRLGGVAVPSLAAVCDAQVVVPLVPMSAFEGVIREMAPMLRPEALVIDACSVKEQPAKVMLDVLPPSVSVIATHPLFGPDSAADGLAGQRLVWCPLRVEAHAASAIADRLRTLGIEVIETTPAEHDRQIAETQVLTHLVGRVLQVAGVRDWPIDTPGYRRLQHVLGTTANDTWQLFADMNRLNRFAPAVRERFRDALDQVLAELADGGSSS